jgi:hypothetical protein
MPVAASSRPSVGRLQLLLLIATVAASGVGAVTALAAADASATNGSWQAHKYQFQYLSDNTRYSCIGLADKLRLLLKSVDARDVRVNPVCLGNSGLPDRFAQASVSFQSLVPSDQDSAAGSTAAAQGVWQHVQWATEQPRTFGPGDCSLIQQLLKTVVPMLTTRNLQTHFDCAQNHDYGSWSVSFEVFAPAEAPK